MGKASTQMPVPAYLPASPGAPTALLVYLYFASQAQERTLVGRRVLNHAADGGVKVSPVTEAAVTSYLSQVEKHPYSASAPMTSCAAREINSSLSKPSFEIP
jgi:hypothetical protein